MTKYGIDPTVICQIIDLANRHHIKTVILVGSRARGDFCRTSDIDLAVQGGDVCRFRLDVEEETHTLLTFDVIDLCSDLSPELREAISKEGVLLYEKLNCLTVLQHRITLIFQMQSEEIHTNMRMT